MATTGEANMDVVFTLDAGSCTDCVEYVAALMDSNPAFELVSHDTEAKTVTCTRVYDIAVDCGASTFSAQERE